MGIIIIERGGVGRGPKPKTEDRVGQNCKGFPPKKGVSKAFNRSSIPFNCLAINYILSMQDSNLTAKTLFKYQ
jgi:hypothetical protein